MEEWRCVLELDEKRRVVGGSTEALVETLADGADLRVYTEFSHNEHIDVRSICDETVQETAEFGVTYVVEGRWAAGAMSLRQPVALPDGFGTRPSMSFFLYNQDGTQAIARPYLDGVPATGEPGSSPVEGPPEMPKYHALDNWDTGTNAPSGNFVYDFSLFRFFVHTNWREVLRHDADGRVQTGTVEALAEAVAEGRSVKVGMGGLCADLGEGAHEVFVETGSCYYYRDRQLFIAGTHPVLRVRPGVPLRYSSRGWDFGWLVLRSDGRAVYRRCDPYTLAFEDRALRLALRWYVR